MEASLAEPQQAPPTESFSLPELEQHVVAACLHDTDILETVSVKYADRLDGKLASLFGAASAYYTLSLQVRKPSR